MLEYNAKSRYRKIDRVSPDYLVLRNIYLHDFHAQTNLNNDYIPIKIFNNDSHPEDSVFTSMTIFERRDIRNLIMK